MKATIWVGPADKKGQTNPLKDHETMFILTLGDENAGKAARTHQVPSAGLLPFSITMEKMIVLDLKMRGAVHA